MLLLLNVIFLILEMELMNEIKHAKEQAIVLHPQKPFTNYSLPPFLYVPFNPHERTSRYYPIFLDEKIELRLE